MEAINKASESRVEGKLRSEARRRGWLTYKLASPGTAGMPDRLVITGAGKVWFVELKAEDGRLSPAQRKRIRELQEHGARAEIAYGMVGVQLLLARMDAEEEERE